MGLTPEMLITFALIIFAAILFVSEVVRIDVVAFCILLLLGLTGIVPKEELFSGFSSDAVISLIGVMIVGGGLERCGVMVDVARWITRFGGNDEGRIRFLLMLVGGIMAGILRSVGAVALLLPVVTRIARRTSLSKSRFLMPLGFCTILGSTLTMVGTGPLIILNSLIDVHWHEVADQPIAHFHLLEVFPVGFGMLFLGLVYFGLLGRYFLPEAKKEPFLSGSDAEHFFNTYHIGGYPFELRVLPESPLNDMELRDIEAQLDPEIAVVGLKNGNEYWMPPLRVDTIRTGMLIAVHGPKGKVQAMAKQLGLRLSPGLVGFIERLNPATSGLSEVVVPPSSQLVGEKFNTLHMRRQHRVQVLAVQRAGKTYRGQELAELTLKPGDTLGIFGQWENITALEKEPDFVVLTSDFPHESYRRTKAPFAVLFAILGIGLVLSGILALPIGLLLSVVGMIFSGVLKIDEAYTAVSWKTVFLFAGLLPLGIALQETGADDWLISTLFSGLQQYSVTTVLTILAVVTSVLTLVLSNVGVTVLMVPLALKLSVFFDSDPRLFALMVAIAASNAFLLPTHQANALIVGPGKYSHRDFFKAGILLTILYLGLALLIVPQIV